MADVFTASDSANRIRALFRDLVNATSFADAVTAVKNLEAEMKVFAGQIAGAIVHIGVSPSSAKIQKAGSTLKIGRTE